MAMSNRAISIKWKTASMMGRPVNDLFLPVKVPLRRSLNNLLPAQDRFCWNDVLRKYRNIGLVIDLTKTTRYYDQAELTSQGIQYGKIFVEGHGSLPPRHQVQEFCDIVDAFRAKSSSRGQLIVVHCTHGLNRTGYMICKYLILRQNVPPDRAIDLFESARGERMERPAYITDIRTDMRSTTSQSHDRNRRPHDQVIREEQHRQQQRLPHSHHIRDRNTYRVEPYDIRDRFRSDRQPHARSERHHSRYDVRRNSDSESRFRFQSRDLRNDMRSGSPARSSHRHRSDYRPTGRVTGIRRRP